MKPIKEIDILHNKKLLIGLNLVSILFLVVFTVFFSWLGALFYSRDSFVFGIVEILLSLLFSLALVVVHELIHALFFKLFGDRETKVRFGFQSGLAYATSPGSLYQRPQMLAILLAPFVLISAALTLAYILGWINMLAYIVPAVLHASGCTGDFYFAYLILSQRGKIWIEDTPVGITIYQKENTHESF